MPRAFIQSAWPSPPPRRGKQGEDGAAEPTLRKKLVAVTAAATVLGSTLAGGMAAAPAFADTVPDEEELEQSEADAEDEDPDAGTEEQDSEAEAPADEDAEAGTEEDGDVDAPSSDEAGEADESTEDGDFLAMLEVDSVAFNPELGYPNPTLQTGVDPITGEVLVNVIEFDAVEDGYVSVWVDWNSDGAFEEAENVALGQAVTAGSNTVTFSQGSNPERITGDVRIVYGPTEESVVSPTDFDEDEVTAEDYEVLFERYILPQTCEAIGTPYQSFTFHPDEVEYDSGSTTGSTLARWSNVAVVNGVPVDMVGELVDDGGFNGFRTGGASRGPLDAGWNVVQGPSTVSFSFYESGTETPINVNAAFTVSDMDGDISDPPSWQEVAVFSADDLAGWSVDETSYVDIREVDGNVEFWGDGGDWDGEPESRFQIRMEGISTFEGTFEGGNNAGFGFNGNGDLAINPGCDGELDLTKTSDAAEDVTYGDTVTYEVTAANVGEGPFTTDNPAVVIDDLSGVLDDGTLVDGSLAASIGGESVAAPVLMGETLVWSGPLPLDAEVVITYQVELEVGGDRQVDNVAFPADIPPTENEIPPTPECGDDGAVCTTTNLPPPPLQCFPGQPGLLYQGTPTTIYGVDLVTGEYEVIATEVTNGNVNGTGYNVLDDYVYGTHGGSGEVIRIGNDGSTQSLGLPTLPNGDPVSIARPIGDIDENGHFWSADGVEWFQIDLEPGSATYMQVLASGPMSGGGIGNATGGFDWAYVPSGGNYLYRLPRAGENFHLYRFNLDTHQHEYVADLGQLDGTQFGAVYADPDFLYASDNTTGNIFRIDVVDGTAEMFAEGPSSGLNDGARCFNSPIPLDFGDAPDSYGTSLGQDGPRHTIVGYDAENNVAPLMLGSLVDAETDGFPGPNADGDDIDGIDDEDGVADQIVVRPGEPATVTVSATNNTNEPATLAGWIDLDGNGTFDAGERVVITVPANSGTAEYELDFPAAGDLTADTYARFRIFSGQIDDPQPTGSATGGEVEDYLVLVTDLDLELDKSSDADEDTRIGDTVTYEVSATATGASDYTEDEPAIVVDDLSGVLDDGTLNEDSITATIDGEGVTAPVLEGDLLIWTGPLASGETVIISYDVELTGAGDREVENTAFPVPPGTPPTDVPTPECGDDGAVCEDINIPALSVEKEASTEEIPAAGEEFSYTVTVTNEGPGDYTESAPAVVEDDLSDVLDDADLIEDSLSAVIDGEPAGEFDLDGDLVTWAGALAAGESVEITYSFTYHGGGDQVMINLACILDGQAVAGEECDDTRIPAALLDQGKTSEASDSPLVTGSEVTYTLWFENSGEAAATVDSSDYLGYVLDDAEFVEDSISAGEGLSAVREDEFLVITGEVPAGERLEVTYTVQVLPADERGDDRLVNHLLDPGTPPEEVPPPPGKDDECEDTQTSTCNPVAGLAVEKTSTADADTRIGDTVTYTVEATNTGNADYTSDNPAVVFDDLAGVLDDGTLDEDSITATIGGEEVTAPALLGTVIAWDGPLAAGETVTITYDVTLTSGGDREVNNVAWPSNTPPGEEVPPTPECGEDGAVCEEFLLPALSVEKEASDAELPAVGEELTYTVVVTSEGPGDYTEDAPARAVDSLTDVLDDADIVEDSLSSSVGAAPVVEGDELIWEGVLAAGESATLTYTVVYHGEGDQRLINEVCVEDAVGDGCASTTTPAALLDQGKTSEASDTPLVTGSEVTYTLWFENSGEAAATVDSSDYLGYVLDDAEFVEDSISADEGLSAVREDEFLVITGEVPAGERLEVTYTVQVLPADERGDDRLVNHLLDPGTPPEEVPPPPGEDDECEDTQTSTCNPVAEISYEKSVEASADPIVEGTELTYTISITNSGATTGPVSREDVLTDVLDDATLTEAPVSDTESVTVSEVEDQRFSIGGELAAGETAEVTYTVTVNPETERGNDSAANFLVTPGNNPPEDGCEEGDPECTDTPLPNVVGGKEVLVDGESGNGAAVEAGEELTYRLGFENLGNATGEVSFADDLSGVLDDAELIAGPALTQGPDTVEVELVDGFIIVTGELAPGEFAGVEYTVQVLADGERGDNELNNTVVKPHDPENPGEGGDCVPHPDESLDCTTSNPIPELVDAKMVDPASGTPVVPGQELTYTIEFENNGQAAGTVNRVDDLTHVLDDAELVEGPSANGGLQAVLEANQIAITGELDAGESAQVTYTVQVKEEDRGDDVLANFVLNPGQNPPEDPSEACEEISDHATCNPVGVISPEKTVDPEAGTEVDPGKVLTYTLSFENTGAGEAEVSYTDHLADVLDDAEWLGNVEASEGLSVTGPEDQLLSVTGTVAAGETATVTYQVEVKDHADLGSGELANFLTPEGFQPPEDCEANNPLCTENPVTDPPEPPAPDTPQDPSDPSDPVGPDTPQDPAEPEPKEPGEDLASTGATIAGLVAVTLALLALGGLFYMISRNRRSVS